MSTFQERNFICKKCQNTGRNMETGHPCGCIDGERILIAQQKRDYETRAERLYEKLSKESLINPTEYAIFGKEELINMIGKILDELKF